MLDHSHEVSTMYGDLKRDISAQFRIKEATEAIASSASIQRRLLSVGHSLGPLQDSDFPTELKPTWHEVDVKLRAIRLGPDQAFVSDQDGEALALSVLALSREVEKYLATH